MLTSMTEHVQSTSNRESTSSNPSQHPPTHPDPSSTADNEDSTQPKNQSKCYKCGKVLWRILTSQLGLIVLLLGYSFAGAAIFKAIEGPNEQIEILNIETFRARVISASYELARQLNRSEYEQKAVAILDEYEEKLSYLINHGITTGFDNVVWDYWGSLFFCATIFTTIGYGHITPATSWGRIATMIYAVIGIPLFLVIMGKFGKLLTSGLKFIWKYVRQCYYSQCCRKIRHRIRRSSAVDRMSGCCSAPTSDRENATSDLPNGTAVKSDTRQMYESTYDNKQDVGHVRSVEGIRLPSSVSINTEYSDSTHDLVEDVFELEEDFNLPPLVAFTITLVYIFLGAFIYTRWEPWTYLEAFYFLFISVSTIGFGDLIPKHPKYFLASSAYIVLGLALVAMLINVIIEFFNRTIDLAKEKVIVVGRQMGLDVDDLESGRSTRSPSLTPSMYSGRLSAPDLQKRRPSKESVNSRNSLLEKQNIDSSRRKRSRRKKLTSVDLSTPCSSRVKEEKNKSKDNSGQGIGNEGYHSDNSNHST